MMEEKTAASYWVWRLSGEQKEGNAKVIYDFSHKLSSTSHVCTQLYERSIQT